jgi:hypothetical protein
MFFWIGENPGASRDKLARKLDRQNAKRKHDCSKRLKTLIKSGV